MKWLLFLGPVEQVVRLGGCMRPFPHGHPSLTSNSKNRCEAFNFHRFISYLDPEHPFNGQGRKLLGSETVLKRTSSFGLLSAASQV